MKTYYVKSRIIALTQEAKYLRSLERKERRQADMLKIRQKLADGGYTPKQVERLARKAFNNLTPKEWKRVGFQDIRSNWQAEFDRPTIQKVEYQLTNAVTAPQPEWIEKHRNAYMDLRTYRKKVVGPEARATQLAYAFLRGKPYSSVESYPYDKRFTGDTGRNIPNWQMVRETVDLFWDVSYSSREEALEAFDKWRPWSQQEREQERELEKLTKDFNEMITNILHSDAERNKQLTEKESFAPYLMLTVSVVVLGVIWLYILSSILN